MIDTHTNTTHPGTYEGNKDYKLVAEFDASESYQFDYYGVWEGPDGKLYYDHDSHCSCFGDFEDKTTSDLKQLTDYRSFRDELHKWAADEWRNVGAQDMAAGLDKVRRALEGNR